MKIRIVHRWNESHIEGCEPEEQKELFDVYHGFFSWFRTKWIIHKGGLTEKELSEYLHELIVGLRSNIKIYWKWQ